MNPRGLVSLIVWCVSLSVAFSGCIYIGPDSSRVNLNEGTVSKIIPEKTTKEEVLALLGPPDEVSDNGRRFTYVRKYEVALVSPGRPGSGRQANAADRYLLKVDFDERGIVFRRNFIAPYEFQDKPVPRVSPYSPPSSYR